MLSTLRQDPFALESVYISLITFDKDVKVLNPLTEVEMFQLPDIETPESGPTHLGAALEELCRRVDQEVRKNTEDEKGDWKPLLFIMTDGCPSDLKKYRDAIPEVRKRNFAIIVSCAAGAKAKEDVLKELSDQVVRLDTMDSSAFKQFFKWVSDSIGTGNISMGATSQIVLPPPPAEIQVVI